MEIKHRRQLRLGLGAVALIAAAVLVIRSGPPEPQYQGVALSEWLDGTMSKKVSLPKIFEVMESVGPEASPWLLQLVERREGFFERRYLRFYGLARSAVRWLPEPRLPRIRGSQHNAARLLSRLAPGTELENRAVTALLSLHHQGERRYVFLFLAGFTNSPEKVVPVLLTGVTNPATFEESVAGLQRFGTLSAPSLYRMARKEVHPHIRPAEMALKRIDEAMYQELSDEKDSRR